MGTKPLTDRCLELMLTLQPRAGEVRFRTIRFLCRPANSKGFLSNAIARPGSRGFRQGSARSASDRNLRKGVLAGQSGGSACSVREDPDPCVSPWLGPGGSENPFTISQSASPAYVPASGIAIVPIVE